MIERRAAFCGGKSSDADWIAAPASRLAMTDKEDDRKLCAWYYHFV
jgi:hypothetical protein